MKNKWIRRAVNSLLILVLMFTFAWSIISDSFFVGIIALFVAAFYFQDNDFSAAIREEQMQEFFDNIAHQSDDKTTASGNK